MLEVIVSGIVVGALYAITGLGLVAIYRATRVLNFAAGGIGAVGAYAAHDFLDLHLPYALVFVFVVLVGGLLGLLVETAVARPLRRLPPITVALGTLGALLILQGIMGARYGYGTYSLPVPFAGVTVLQIGSFKLSADQLLILGLGVVATLFLALLFARTRLGLAMRAVSSGPQTAELLGVHVSRTRRAAWVIGGAYSALAALLVTPLTYLTPSSFTGFLLTAFAAVVLGGFTSLGGVVLGACAFGVVINVVETYLPAGLTQTYTFIVVALVLLFRPHGLFGRHEHEVSEPRIPAAPRRLWPWRVQGAPAETPAERGAVGGSSIGGRAVAVRAGAGWLVLLVVLALLPSLISGSSIYLMASALATFIAVVGLNIITGYAGQVSLGHAGFLTLGAYVTAAAVVHAGLPIYVALLVALVFGALAGMVVGLPATGLTGIYLALLTLVFTFAVPEVMQRLGGFTGGSNGLPVAAPDALSTPIGQYWFALALAVAAGLLVLALGATRLGRGWRAVRDSEAGARGLGLNPTAVKLGAFALSSALAGLGGGLTAMLSGFVSPQSFGVFESVYLLLAVILGGSGSVLGSLVGALFITILPTVLPEDVPADVLFGLAILVVLIVAPEGVVGLLRTAASRATGWTARRGSSGATAATDDTAERPTGTGERPLEATAMNRARVHAVVHARQPGEPAPLLELRDIVAGYGQLTVLRGVSLDIRVGEIVAVLGANGAGKSTLLRTISQTVPRSAGSITWRGDEVGVQRSPHQVARVGIAHVPEGRAVFPDLTVEENLRMGSFGLGTRQRDDGQRAGQQDQVFAQFPRLLERRRQHAGTLSGGEQQMLAIGRALMSAPDLLLLDEPSLGLAPAIVEQVFENLQRIAETGVAVLLVEQNASAALALADRGYLLSGGRVAFSGSGEQLQSDDRVAEAYFALRNA